MSDLSIGMQLIITLTIFFTVIGGAYWLVCHNAEQIGNFLVATIKKHRQNHHH